MYASLNYVIIDSDNGLSPARRQSIIWINAGKLLIGPLGTDFSEILIWIQTFSFKKMRLKVSSAKWRPFCLGLNVLISCIRQPFTEGFWLLSQHLVLPFLVTLYSQTIHLCWRPWYVKERYSWLSSFTIFFSLAVSSPNNVLQLISSSNQLPFV